MLQLVRFVLIIIMFLFSTPSSNLLGEYGWIANKGRKTQIKRNAKYTS